MPKAFKERHRYECMGKKKKPGKKRTIEKKDVMSAPEAYLSLETAFNSAPRLFDPRRMQKALEEALPHANLKVGIFAFLVGSVLFTTLLFIINRLLIYAFKAVAEEGAAVPVPEELSLLLLFVITVSSFIVTVVVEYISFLVAVRIGGKGTLAQQFYLSSVVQLSLAIGSFIMLGIMIPCIGILMPFLYFIISLYLGFYVHSKAYALVHAIALWKAFAIVVLGIVITLALSVALNIALGEITGGASTSALPGV